MHRQFAASLASVRKRKEAWWALRVEWLASVTGEDPAVLAAHERSLLWTLLPGDEVWPDGLRTDQEPQMRLDRRFGRRYAR